MCRDSKQIALKCLYAFTEMKDYTTCFERCRFAFKNCGRRCAEDHIRCKVLPLGGEQQVTVVVAGLASNSMNLTYDTPRVWYVIPPELEASRLLPGEAIKEPELLTLIGTNFGVDMAIAYAGRKQSSPIGPYSWDYPNLKYDENVIPANYLESIEWWDLAQYRTCFSVSDTATPVPPGTPERLVSSYRKCDAGVSLSEMINLGDTQMRYIGEDTARDLQVMVIKAPSVTLPNSQVSLAVAVMVEVLGQRSAQSPTLNSSVVFRQKCSDFAPNMGRLTLPSVLATRQIRNVVARSEYQLTSWPSQGMLVMFGGKTVDQPQTRTIYTSSFTGINGWKEMQYRDDVPWFSARTNSTVGVYGDVLYLLAGSAETARPKGSTKPGIVYYSDVWIYANTKGVANYYKRADTKEPQVCRH